MKGASRGQEEIKHQDFNEELKEGFIGDLCKSSRKLSSGNKIDDCNFDLPNIAEDRSRCKTALINPGMRSTGEDNGMTKFTPITPMINNIFNENEGNHQSNLEQELQALVSENGDKSARNSPELEAQLDIK